MSNLTTLKVNNPNDDQIKTYLRHNTQKMDDVHDEIVDFIKVKVEEIVNSNFSFDDDLDQYTCFMKFFDLLVSNLASTMLINVHDFNEIPIKKVLDNFTQVVLIKHKEFIGENEEFIND